MLKLSDNPPMLYPELPSLRDIPGRWWVAHTKSRFEKTFAHDLCCRGISYFLPMVRRTIVSGGRRRQGLSPLFSGYAFFAGDEHARHAALATDRLCQVIPATNQARLIDELCSIQRALSGELKLDPYPWAAVGRRCRIVRGALRGLEGIVIHREDGAMRLVLQVSMLGQGVAVEVEGAMLEGAG